MRFLKFFVAFCIGGSGLGMMWSQTPPPQTAIQKASETSTATLTVTLQDAIDRARKNSPEFQASLTAYGLAHENRVQGRAGFFPAATYNNQYLYTQGNGTPSGRFIANNGVHEYLSQANLHETLSLSQIADYRKLIAGETLAKAKSEIAARGLVVTVVESFYSLAASQRKLQTAQRAADEAQHFLKITQDLEHGGEVAHSDVIKAQLQFQDRERDLREAQLARERDHVELALLLFPTFNRDFDVQDDLDQARPLPPQVDVEAAAQQNNPELRAALAAVRQAKDEVAAARGEYFPAFSLDYFYGIDAPTFSTKTDGIPNLGSSAVATLNIPIFNWGITRSRVKQADLQRQQAERELSFTQRKLLGDLQTLYSEAQAAESELESLHQSAVLAEESLRLNLLRYQGGETSVLEAVDAQNTLRQAQNAYNDGQVRYQVALARLQTLTGNF
ncbi:MAG: TolC family protein [Acidobacteriia bacterium]|nr:TolC family protein [Terriglobia bacterium]